MPGNTKVRMLSALLVAFSLLCVSSPTVFAQGTGSISGLVIDAKTKKALGFANIVVVGTTQGAMSLDDGKFTVPGVPIGTYTVKAMMMGYKTIELKGVEVNNGQTTEISFELEETIVAQTQVIEVLGEKPMVEVTSSDVRQGVTEEQVKEMPVDDAVEALALKSGMVKTGDELHARGGRSGEIQMQIDGVPVDDPLGGQSMDVGLLGVSNSEIITGGMDAEYGNNQSGVINISTKEGGPVFRGEFRYMTDDFGRADKTYTNFDRVSVGFGGPTPWKSLRYYVSGEASFQDGENVTIEPRQEHKVEVLGMELFKARDRMDHTWNLQSKLTWNRAPLKVSGEFIYQGSRLEQYYHNWNVEGYVQKVYYFQRLRPSGTGAETFVFGGTSVQNEGPWLQEVADNDPFKGNFDPSKPHPRPVVVEQLVRDPDTGEQTLITYNNFRAVDLADGTTILWDEALLDGSGQVSGFKPWILFEGFQFPFSNFSNFKDDSSYVFFNSATRTPETQNDNYHIKFGFNHNINDNLLYTINVSRLQFNRLESVDNKTPAEYSTAGTPTTFPDGTVIESGITNAVWNTDPDNPYLVTAYDYPFYSKRETVQYLLKTDITSTQVKGHRMRGGVQFIYNDLFQDDRVQPGLTRRNPIDDTVQQGRNVNILSNINYEGAVYAQDKWEYEGMVVNAGLRWEFFTTGNVDIQIQSSEVDPAVQEFKYNWSPRLGFAFPITDRDKFFFHYGRFTQWPSKSYLFATQDAIGSFGTLGNPNLGEELTVSYQAGIGHQFTEDVAGTFAVYSKDIYGLISSARVTDDSTGIQSYRFINKTYASARGLEISLEKRLTRRLGFELYYTYAFADGVASDSDFGRSAEGLTHLPTDETPLNWDQRHTFNVTLRLQDRNNWGATAIYQYGSGLPWTPVDRFARLQDPTVENSRRFDPTHRLSLQGRKKFSIYGRELTLFFEGRNLFDQDILLPGQEAPTVFPGMVVATMDGGSYITETGRYGGAYLQDIDDDGIDDFIPVNDPSVFETHRFWRVGFGFEF